MYKPKLNRLLKKNNCSKTRVRDGMLSMSELVLILILFPYSEYKCFKWCYMSKVCGEYRSYFRKLPSYNRFIELMPKWLLRLLNYLMYAFKK